VHREKSRPSFPAELTDRTSSGFI